MPRKLIVGPEVVAFGGVVVDDVEDHLDAGLVERPDHGLELGDRAAGVPVRRRTGSAARRSRKCCSPSSFADPRSISRWSCRNWCTGISSIAVTLSDLRWSMITGCAEPGVGAAQFLGDAGMGLRHALDVGLVDDGLVVRRARRAVGRPAGRTG